MRICRCTLRSSCFSRLTVIGWRLFLDEVDGLDVVLLQVFVGRQARDALEVASEETLAGEVVFHTDRLDVALVAVERLLDGEDDVLVDGLGSGEPRELVHDGGQVFGGDVQLIGIVLHGAFLPVLLVEQVEELLEDMILSGILDVVDDVLLLGEGEELGDVGCLIGTEHDLLQRIVLALMLTLDAQVAIEQGAHLLSGEAHVAELEGVVVEQWVHVGAPVDVCHEVMTGEEREEDAARLLDHDIHARHDDEVFVGFHFDVGSTHNHAEGATQNVGDVDVFSIIDFLTGMDDGVALLVEVVHDDIFPLEGREKCILGIVFCNGVSFQNHS